MPLDKSQLETCSEAQGWCAQPCRPQGLSVHGILSIQSLELHRDQCLGFAAPQKGCNFTAKYSRCIVCDVHPPTELATLICDKSASPDRVVSSTSGAARPSGVQVSFKGHALTRASGKAGAFLRPAKLVRSPCLGGSAPTPGALQRFAGGLHRLEPCLRESSASSTLHNIYLTGKRLQRSRTCAIRSKTTPALPSLSNPL